MSFAEFQQSIARDSAPPAGLGPALQALWHDGKGDWERAHACAQEEKNRNGSWVHAYLHRKEGDDDNALYWYTRSSRPVPAAGVALVAEWAAIATELLGPHAPAKR